MSPDNETQPQCFPFYISICYDNEKFVLIYLLSSDSSINIPFQIIKSIVFKVHFKDCKADCFQPVIMYISVLTESHTDCE